jgi:hypothetical protein
MTHRDNASILNFISAIIIVVGLPTGFYFAFQLLDVVDKLKDNSFDIGEELMRGIQSGVNETFVNELAKRITQTIFSNTVLQLPDQ